MNAVRRVVVSVHCGCAIVAVEPQRSTLTYANGK
jgi:hypothetical protein